MARIPSSFWTGTIVLGALLALSLGGVDVVRAADPAAGPQSTAPELQGAGPLELVWPQQGSACRVGGPPKAPKRTASQAMASIQAAMLANAGGDDVVVLNGRGYNYPSRARQIDTHTLDAEAARQRRAR